MLSLSQLTLAEPPTDRPAASDPTTMRGFRASQRVRVRAILLLTVLVIGLPLLAGTAGLVIGLALAVAAGVWAGPVLVRDFRWLRGIQRSAGGNRWRRVRTGLVRGGPGSLNCVVMVEDGAANKLLTVHGIPWAGQLSIAYAGRMWILGPDVAGRQAVALLGMRIPFRAEALPELPAGTQPGEPVPGPNGTAVDEPITAATEQLIVRRAWFAMAGGTVLVGWGILVAALGSPLIGWLWAAGWAAQLAVAAWTNRYVPAISGGLGAGPWLPFPARLAPWPDSPRRRASISGEIRLPDGRTLAVDLPVAEENLVANVQATGQLWFAGPPQPGRTSAVGIPGLPLITAARVR